MSDYLRVARDALDTANDVNAAIGVDGVEILYEQAFAFALVSVAESLAELAAAARQKVVELDADGNVVGVVGGA